MSIAQLKTGVCLAIAIIVRGEFAVDLPTPFRIAGWVGSVIPLPFALFYVGGWSLSFALAANLSIVLLAGFFLPPKGMNSHLALVGREMETGRGMMCLMAVSVRQRHRAVEDGGHVIMQRRIT